MPVNSYDDRKVSLRRPHGNGDLDIVGASYTRRKANVTEALRLNETADLSKLIHVVTLREAMLSYTFINSRSQVSDPGPKDALVFF